MITIKNFKSLYILFYYETLLTNYLLILLKKTGENKNDTYKNESREIYYVLFLFATP